MAETSGLISLGDLVKEVIWTSKKPMAEFDRFLQLATRAYRELRLTTINEGVKYEKKTPGSINEINFPEDLEDFVALGVPINGEIWFLSPEDKIVTTTTITGLQETLDSSDGEGVDIYKPDGYAYYTRGGVNTEGYYNVDYNKRRIIVNSLSRDEVILAYVSSGIVTDNETYVPYKYYSAIEAFIMWKDSAYVEGKENRGAMMKQNYAEIRQDLAEQELDFDGMIQEFYKSYTPLAKR